MARSRDGLRERGLLRADPTPTLTSAGLSLLADVEARTDEAAWRGDLSIIGEDGIDEIEALLAPSVAAVRASGMLPDLSPTGLLTAAATRIVTALAGGVPRRDGSDSSPGRE